MKQVLDLPSLAQLLDAHDRAVSTLALHDIRADADLGGWSVSQFDQWIDRLGFADYKLARVKTLWRALTDGARPNTFTPLEERRHLKTVLRDYSRTIETNSHG